MGTHTINNGYASRIKGRKGQLYCLLLYVFQKSRSPEVYHALQLFISIIKSGHQCMMGG